MENIAEVMKSILSNLCSQSQYVLDVGTGSANMALSLSELGIRCITIDKSDNAANIAKSTIAKYDGKLKPLFMKMDACKMDFIDETFDAVVAYKSLHHIKNSLNALEEMFRVCKPQGKIIIVEHSIQSRLAIDFINSLNHEEHPKEINLDVLKAALQNYSGRCEQYSTQIGEIFVLTKDGELSTQSNLKDHEEKMISLGRFQQCEFYYDVNKNRLIKENKINHGFIDLFDPVDRIPDTSHSLCLNVANTCNLGCKYCYADGGNYKHEECIMPYPIAMKSLDWYQDYRKGVYHVIFFGGEPLVNKQLVRDVLRENKYEVTYSINTNGILLDEEFVDDMSKHNGKISLSIDGKEKIHDKLRVYKNGKPTYQDVLHTYYKVPKENRNRIWARMTISNEIDDIYENVKHIVDIGFKHIDLSFVAGNYELSEKESQIADWKESIDKLAQYCLKVWIEDDILIYPFVKVYQSAIFGLKAMHTCTAGRELLSVQPDGTIVPCFKYNDIRLGHINTGIEEDKVQEFETFKQIQRELICSGCWVFDFCGGLCSKDTNVVIKIKSIRCQLTQYLISRCLYYLSVQNENNPKSIKKFTYMTLLGKMVKKVKSKEETYDS